MYVSIMIMKIRRYVIDCFLILCCFVLVSGCSGEVTAKPAIVTSTIDLMGDDSGISRAVDLVAAQCMRARGYDIEQESSYVVNPANNVYGEIGGVFSSKEEAVAGGYYSTVDYSKGYNVIDMYGNTLKGVAHKKFELDYNGNDKLMDDDKDRDLACDPLAIRIVYGSHKSYGAIADTVQDFYKSGSGSALDDEEVRSAINEYSSCMNRAGYSVKGLHAGKFAKKRFGVYRKLGDQPNAKERALVSADFDCQESVNLRSVIKKVFSRIAAKWMVENESELLARHDALSAARQKAKQIIEGTFTYEQYAKDHPEILKLNKR